jgi:hypothetical protein
MTTGTIIAIIVAGVIGAFAFYLMGQNEDLMKKNIELMRKESEREKGLLRIRYVYKVLTADRYDDFTLNNQLDKYQRDGWEFGGINGGFIILRKSEEIKEGDV